jgi:hypothetical protein
MLVTPHPGSPTPYPEAEEGGPLDEEGGPLADEGDSVDDEGESLGGEADWLDVACSPGGRQPMSRKRRQVHTPRPGWQLRRFDSLAACIAP